MQTFRDFMDSSLYHPTEGFYSRRNPKEDFYTAPELHPAFARTLAAELIHRLSRAAAARPKSPLYLVEMGSGSGRLARQILEAVAQEHPAWLGRFRYVLIERVDGLLLDSLLSLEDTGARLMGYTSFDELKPICGVIFSNELVDAMPVHVLKKQDGNVFEVYVEKKRKHGASFQERLGPLSTPELEEAAAAMRKHMGDGQRHAVNLEARAWMRKAAVRLSCGTLLTVDYGKRFSEAAPNPPRTFFRHQVGNALTERAGRQDLTASADFEDLISVGEEAGLTLISYDSMSRFLIDRGILERLPDGGGLDAYKERMKIKTLFHPDGMGEKFKVLIQEKGVLS